MGKPEHKLSFCWYKFSTKFSNSDTTRYRLVLLAPIQSPSTNGVGKFGAGKLKECHNEHSCRYLVCHPPVEHTEMQAFLHLSRCHPHFHATLPPLHFPPLWRHRHVLLFGYSFYCTQCPLPQGRTHIAMRAVRGGGGRGKAIILSICIQNKKSTYNIRKICARNTY